MQSSQLKSILAENALVSYEPGNEVVLREDVTELAVTQMPPDVAVVNMDVVGHLPGIGRGVLKWICDFLLVRGLDGADHAIFIELKETLRENKKGMEQLRRSLPILKYLVSACQIHGDEQKKNMPTPGVRYYLVGMKNSRKLDKQPVRPRRQIQKENYKEIDVHTYLGSRISFNLLRNAGPD